MKNALPHTEALIECGCVPAVVFLVCFKFCKKNTPHTPTKQQQYQHQKNLNHIPSEMNSLYYIGQRVKKYIYVLYNPSKSGLYLFFILPEEYPEIMLGALINILIMCFAMAFAESSRPNIVVVLVDDVGWADFR